MRLRVTTGAVIAAACAAAAGGCGKGSDRASVPAPQPSTDRTVTTSGTATLPPPARSRGARHGSHGVTIRLQRGLAVSRKASAGRGWPVPRAVVSSFPIVHASPNALCPANVLSSMPPHGVYIVVAEYTKPPPPGIPPGTPPGPRGDLSRLNIRPSEVECWNGPGGSASFRERGRDFHVELLLGPRVTASERRRALEALASLRVSG